MFILLLFIALFIIIAIFVMLIIPFIYNLTIILFTKIFSRNKVMDVKPPSNHKMRIVTLEDGHFQDETLYKLKKGIRFVFLE